MKFNKKTLFIGLGLLAILATLYLYFQLKGKSALVSSPSTLPSSHYGDVNLESAITAEDFKTVPPKMTVYDASMQPFTEAEVAKIAQSLDFTSAPSILDNPQGGKVINWYQETETFKVNLPYGPFDYKVREFSYENVSPAIESALTQTGLDFLTSHQFVLRDQILLDSVRIEPYAAERETGAVEVMVYLVKFRQSVNDYPIVNLTDGVGTVSVNIDSQKKVIRAFVDKVQNYAPKQQMETIPFSQYQKVFQQAKVQYVQSHEVNNSTIVKVSIKSVKPGYLKQVSGDQVTLRPILILSGKAMLSDNTSADATLYLPATKADY